MPTKPIDVYTFATNANYSTGPFTGSPTKVIPTDLGNGFVPGIGIPAAHHNYLWNISGSWINDWLSQGTSAADLDAHIVETDSTGQTNIAGLVLGGTAAGYQSLIVTENSGATSAAGSFTNSGGGFALLGTTNGASAAIRGVCTGTAPGVEGRALGTNNNGVEGVGRGTGAGVVGEGGNDGPGVVGTGGGSSFANGMEATGGAVGGHGILAVTQADGNYGVLGQTTATSSVFGAAVYGSVQGGDATALYGNSAAGDGYAVVAQADSSAPVRAAIRMVPQSDDPSVGSEGDLMYNSNTDEVRAYANSRWQTLMSEENGYTRAITALGSATNNTSVSWDTVVTGSLASPYDPKRTGTIMIHAAAEFGAQAGTLHPTFQVRIQDVTNGATVWSQTLDNPNGAAASYDRPWSIMVPYSLPSAGPIDFELQFRRVGSGGTGIAARDASMHVFGVY